MYSQFGLVLCIIIVSLGTSLSVGVHIINIGLDDIGNKAVWHNLAVLFPSVSILSRAFLLVSESSVN